ncbi:MAG: hemagglutinin repeat-containing protein [Pseudomonadota bacterium]
MNKNCFRVIFNKARGLLMAVAETTASAGKNKGNTSSPNRREPVVMATIKPLIFSLWSAFGLVACLSSAQAQIVASPTAPAAQQATVGSAGNGVPVVNIQAPSAAGVSHNVFSQFDIARQGAILNNSGSTVQTQLGGQIAGNALLNGLTARVILNEVNSSNPSILRGFVEVAGRKAQVVIANPAGITCDGCGFINANQATLTTGSPLMNGGNLEGYLVQRGAVVIEGAGLDGSLTDYTQILARAAQINADLFANDLTVVTGANRIAFDASSIEKIAGAGATPTFAIDVGALGGMYAGKIRLIGTDAGVGVRNAGIIGAAIGAVTVNADGLLNSGGITGQEVRIDTGTARVDNTAGTILAKRSLSIESGTLQNDSGLLQADGSLSIDTHGQSLNNINSDLNDPTASKGIVSKGELTLRTGLLNNQAGYIGAKKSTSISSQKVSNNAEGVIVGESSIAFNAGSEQGLDVDNQGRIETVGNLSFALGNGTLNNANLLRSQADLLIQATKLVNRDSVGKSNAGIQGNNVEIKAAAVDNARGKILAERALTISASDTITNESGLLSSRGQLVLRNLQADQKTLAIHNMQGTVVAGRNLQIEAASMTDGKEEALAVDTGNLISEGDLSLRLTKREWTYQPQSIKAIGNANIEVYGLSLPGEIGAGGVLNINTNGGGLSNLGRIEADRLILTASTENSPVKGNHLISNSGLISGREVEIRSAELTNVGIGHFGSGYGRIYGDTIAISGSVKNGVLPNTKDTTVLFGNNVAATLTATGYDQIDPQVSMCGPVSTIAARERLDIAGPGIFNQRGMIFSGGDLSIGGELDQNNRATGRAGWIQNLNNGSIEALGNLSLSANSILNQDQFAYFYMQPDFGYGNTFQEYQLSGSPKRYLPSEVSIIFDEVYHLVTPEGTNSNFNRYDYTRTVRESSLVGQRTAYIVAGGNIRLDATSVRNNLSSIIAGGAINATVTSLVNSEEPHKPFPTDNLRITQDRGTVTNFHRIQEKGRDRQGEDPYPYLPSAVEETVSSFNTVYRQQDTERFPGGLQTDKFGGVNVTQTAQGPNGGALGIVRTGSVNLKLPVGGIFQLADPTTGVAPVIVPMPTPATPLPPAPVLNVPGLIVTGSPLRPQLQTLPQSLPQSPITNVSVSTPNQALPPSAGNGGSLIITDEQFIDARKIVSSNELLIQLGIDPATTLTRLGDGFYEQRLVREQLGDLTGRRFFAGYSNDETQYRALLNNGVTAARALQLKPGIGLSAEQMGQLTSDIVWLVENTVTLPNGTTRRVLVPQLYVMAKPGDIDGSGSLISGESLNINATGDITNNGILAGRNGVTLTADNINNVGGRIAAVDVDLLARLDVNNLGGQIDGVDRVAIEAGRDVNISSETRSTKNEQGSRTVLSRLAAVYTTGADGRMSTRAGRDININGAQLINAGENGQTALVAGQNINVGVVKESSDQKLVWNAQNKREESASSEVGSIIKADGNLILQAGADVNVRAAQIASERNGLAVVAGNAVNITAGQATQTVDEAHQTKGTSGYLSKTVTSTRDTVAETTAIGSSLGGNQIYIQAGTSLKAGPNGNINIEGSQVISDAGTMLAAGNDINIAAATQEQSRTNSTDTKTSGVFSSGGFGVTAGKKQQTVTTDNAITTSVGSQVGSVAGGVTVSAGNAYRQTGSDISAPQRDVSITARTIDIVAAENTSRRSDEVLSKQSGVTVAVTSGLVSAVQSVEQMKEASGNATSDRMAALAAANAAFTAKNTAKSVVAAQGNANGQVGTGKLDANNQEIMRDATAAERAGGIDVSVSYGSSKSQNNSVQNSTTAVGSSIAAGGNLNIQATGAGAGSNLTIQGSNIQAGNDATLQADGAINLLAAKNTADQKSTSQNSSASVGVSYGTGGLMFNASASKGRGNADGSDVSWTETNVDAGKTLTLRSGGDTTLKGAVVSGEQVIAQVGGNLAIESLQDTSTYKSKQTSVGGSVSVGMGAMSGSVNAAKAKVDSNYASVVEQSGIRAGDGGFQVDVKGNTALTGGVISSTQTAVDEDSNRFATGGTLTANDIQNQAAYNASSVSVNVGSGMNAKSEVVPGGTSAGFGKDSGSTSSTTVASISGVTGNKDARTGDQKTGVEKIFDADKVQKDIDAQTTITNAFGKNAPKAVAEFSGDRSAELNDQAKAAADSGNATQAAELREQAQKWEEGGVYRAALHAAIGALAGGLQGAAGAGVSSLAAPTLAQVVNDPNLPAPVRQVLIASAGTAIGFAIGGTTGAAAGLNQTANNFLRHEQADAMRKETATCQAKSKGCSDEDVMSIVQKYRALSTQNIAKVESCIVSGNVQCVNSLMSQAATAAEVSNILPFGYGSQELQFIERQNNVQIHKSVRGLSSIFGKDAEIAQEVAEFRKNNCAGFSVGACDGLAEQALNDYVTRTMILSAIGGITARAGGGIGKIRLSRSNTGRNSDASVPAVGAKVDGEVIHVVGELVDGSGRSLGRINPKTGSLEQQPSLAGPARANSSSDSNQVVSNGKGITTVEKPVPSTDSNGGSRVDSELSVPLVGTNGAVAATTVITPAMETKILYGERVINASGTPTNRLIGAHGGEIANSNPNYAVEVFSLNADGTRNAKLVTQFSDGNVSNIKTSTLFPENWTSSQSIGAVRQVGDMLPVATRADGAALYQSTVNGVKIEVIKIGNDVTAGYPVGSRGFQTKSYFLTGKN